jgi:hypothetical protein
MNMKTYIILKIMNVILATAGPVPYDLNECKNRIVEFNSIVDNTFKDAKKVGELRKRWPTLKREDVGYECVESNERPKIANEEKQ